MHKSKMSPAVPALEEIWRADVPALRTTFRKLGLIVAETDRRLRYVWIENPHVDFSAVQVIGKRDDQLILTSAAAEIMTLKSEVLATKQRAYGTLLFQRPDGPRRYHFLALPIVADRKRDLEGVLTGAFEMEA